LCNSLSVTVQRGTDVDSSSNDMRLLPGNSTLLLANERTVLKLANCDDEVGPPPGFVSDDVHGDSWTHVPRQLVLDDVRVICGEMRHLNSGGVPLAPSFGYPHDEKRVPRRRVLLPALPFGRRYHPSAES